MNTLPTIVEYYTSDGKCDIKELCADSKNVHPFRYRVDDVLACITTRAIKEARLDQPKTEIVACERLQVRDPVCHHKERLIVVHRATSRTIRANSRYRMINSCVRRAGSDIWSNSRVTYRPAVCTPVGSVEQFVPLRRDAPWQHNPRAYTPGPRENTSIVFLRFHFWSSYLVGRVATRPGSAQCHCRVYVSGYRRLHAFARSALARRASTKSRRQKPTYVLADTFGVGITTN